MQYRKSRKAIDQLTAEQRHVQMWLDRGLARPAVQRGLEVTAA